MFFYSVDLHYRVMTAQSLRIALALVVMAGAAGRAQTSDGFTSLFNGRDFAGWKVPAGDNGHWRIADGVIDYDAASEAKDKDLWS